MAETHGGGVIGVLVRCLCIAAGALVAGFVLAVLAPGAERAHADSGPEPDDAVGGAVADGSTDVGVFWAQPDALSSAAARRAVEVTGEPAADTWVVTPRSADDAPATPSIDAQRARSTTSTPIGAVGSGSGSSDAGPSMAQLAVLASALAAVPWLWQRLRGADIVVRSAFVTLSLERPG